jgi:hypothetical protein
MPFGAEINYAMLQGIYGTTRSTTDQKSQIRGQTSAFPPSLYRPQPLPRARVREALRHAAADLRELLMKLSRKLPPFFTSSLDCSMAMLMPLLANIVMSLGISPTEL